MSSRTSSHSNHTPPTRRASTLQQSISSQSAINGHSYHRPSCQQEECEHGLLSPHASRPTSADSNKARHTGNAPDSTFASDHLDHVPHHTASDNGGVFGGRHDGDTDLRHAILGDAVADGVLGSGTGDELDGAKDGKGGRGGDGGDRGTISTTQWLARKHGVKGRRIMYIPFPESRSRVL